MSSIYRRNKFWDYKRHVGGGKYQYIRLYSQDGKRVKSERIAQDLQRVLDRKLGEGTNAFSESTVARSIELYREETKRKHSPNTFRADSYRFERWKDKLGNTRLLYLTRQDIKNALDAIQKQYKFGTVTRNHYLKNFKAFTAWCVVEGHLIDDPILTLELDPAESPESRWIPIEKWPDFLEHVRKESPHHFPMIAAGLFSGLRLGELLHQEWRDFEFGGNMIRVSVKADWTPKSRKPRTMPLFPALKGILEPLSRKDGYAFVTPEGKPYASDPREEVIRRPLAAIGMVGDGLGWHTLRHSWLTGLLEVGFPIWPVSRWAGHASVKTTEKVYAHVRHNFDPELRKKIDLLAKAYFGEFLLLSAQNPLFRYNF